MVELLASNGIPKDTTHVSVIDKEGNMFDATPSGGWIGGAVILADTGIAIDPAGAWFAIRGENTVTSSIATGACANADALTPAIRTSITDFIGTNR